MKRVIPIEAFVLAGGKSSRMGSDKGMVLLNGKPMISHVLSALSEVNIPVKIISSDVEYKKFRFPVFPDVVEEKGPLGGLYTAYKNTNAEVILLVSCDMPFISSKAINSLLSYAKDEIVVPVVEERLNPLFALYPVSLEQDVGKRIHQDRLKMTDFILENRHTLVSSIAREMPDIFRNINDRKELKMAEEKWKNLE